MPSPVFSRWRLVFLFLIAGSALILAPRPAAADVGPKPEMWIDVTYQGKPLADGKFNAALLTCRSAESIGSASSFKNGNVPGLESLDLQDASGCRWTYPAAPVWGGDGEKGRAHFSYMLPNQFRVAVYVPSLDRLFVTARAELSGMHSEFKIDLLPDGTGRIEPASLPRWEGDWSLSSIFLALPVTLVVELAIVFIWARRSRADWRLLLVVGLIANLVTLPVLWGLSGLVSWVAGGAAAVVALVFLEFFAFAVEGILYWQPGRLRFFNALALAFVANLASFTVGLLIH